MVPLFHLVSLDKKNKKNKNVIKEQEGAGGEGGGGATDGSVDLGIRSPSSLMRSLMLNLRLLSTGKHRQVHAYS